MTGPTDDASPSPTPAVLPAAPPASDPTGQADPTGQTDPADVHDYHESSLWRWTGPASLIGAALFALLGWFLVAGALAYGGDDALANARPADLVRILDSLETENDRLEQEQRRLQAELAALTSGASQEALAQARDRLESLEILAGTTPVSGPGVRIVIRDPDGGVDASDLLEAVQELRDAGAESIAINEQRVVVATWFAEPGDDQPEGVVISGQLSSSPFTIQAIGDPETLSTAMRIPGGVEDSVQTAGAQFELDQREEVVINATVPLVVPEYAEPVTAE